MRQKSMTTKDTAEQAVRDIRRKTRKQYSAEEKIRIVFLQMLSWISRSKTGSVNQSHRVSGSWCRFL